MHPVRSFISERVADVPPSGIRRFFDIAATMDDVISLGIGEPDFVTPDPILAAGIKALKQGETHYTSNSGLVELRRAIAEQLDRLYGQTYDPASEILCPIRKVHQYTIMCASTASQYAALAAIREGEPHVQEMVAEYDRRRRLIVDGLKQIGLKCFELYSPLSSSRMPLDA
jgi:aspartate/methionine/tyrosine aminotransferase